MSDADEPEPDEFAPLRQALADLLAVLRADAGLTQQQLAVRLGYARVTVAGAETGERVPGEAFWVAADNLLTPGGGLRAAYDRLAAARRNRKQCLARLAEAEREARVARWRAASDLPVGVVAARAGWPIVAVEDLAGEGGEVERRGFLGTVAAVSVGAALPEPLAVVLAKAGTCSQPPLGHERQAPQQHRLRTGRHLPSGCATGAPAKVYREYGSCCSPGVPR